LTKLAHTRLFSGRRSRLGRLRRAAGTEQTLHHFLRGAHPRDTAEDRGHCRHSFAIGLLALAGPYRPFCPLGLDHGNALAVHRRYQDRAGIQFWGVLLVESVKVLGGIKEHFFQTALGNRHAGNLGDAHDGLMERTLHRSPDGTLLQLVRKRAGG
jgi:hypothetical protein